MKGRRGRNRDGLVHRNNRGDAVNRQDLTVIWTPEDLRAAVTAARALAEPDLGVVAPVIDITTRERIA